MGKRWKKRNLILYVLLRVYLEWMEGAPSQTILHQYFYMQNSNKFRDRICNKRKLKCSKERSLSFVSATPLSLYIILYLNRIETTLIHTHILVSGHSMWMIHFYETNRCRNSIMNPKNNIMVNRSCFHFHFQ